MNTSQANGRKKTRQRFRRGHRWAGVSVVAFVLILAISGILLNHSSDVGLDRRYVTSQWLLDAYGMEVPEPTSSYAAATHRVTLVGERLFLDGNDVGTSARSLAGIAVLDELLIVAADKRALVMTRAGDLVEAMDLGAFLRDPLARVGVDRGRVVLQSGDLVLRSDTDVSVFDVWSDADSAEIEWSTESPLDDAERQAIASLYRGHGLTVERVLLDLHSGRFFALPGRLMLDFVALLMIVLSLTGLFLSRKRNRRQNGARGPRRHR